MKAPCLDCKYRDPKCHVYCIAYAKYRNDMDKAAQAENNTFWIDYHYATMGKMKRKKNKRLLDRKWN